MKEGGRKKHQQWPTLKASAGVETSSSVAFSMYTPLLMSSRRSGRRKEKEKYVNAWLFFLSLPARRKEGLTALCGNRFQDVKDLLVVDFNERALAQILHLVATLHYASKTQHEPQKRKKKKKKRRHCLDLFLLAVYHRKDVLNSAGNDSTQLKRCSLIRCQTEWT